MKSKLFKLSLIACTLLPASHILAQVTIGSGLKPSAGALLDLKEKSDGSSTKGLSMPRVKLTTDNALTDIQGAAGLEAVHTGLTVYHVSGEAKPQCAAIADGIYVWDGAKWQGIGVKQNEMPTIGFSDKDIFDIPSGHDARGTTIGTQSVNITWKPDNIALPWTATNTIGAGVKFTGTPLTASPLAAGGTAKFEMTADAMPTPAINNPWQSRETDINFSVANECATISKSIKINQTNYALKVNNSFNHSLINQTTDVGTHQFKIETNAQWKVSIKDSGKILTSTLPIEGIATGSDNKIGGTEKSNFKYTLQGGASRYNTAFITFEDTNPAKRAKDITVTISALPNCKKSEPSLKEWAEMAGFSAADINNISNKGGTLVDENNKPVTSSTGVQIHKDQSGNIFLSSNFGAAGRWMTTNLAARKFAPDNDPANPRTGIDNVVIEELETNASSDPDFKKVQWGFPDGGVGAKIPTAFSNNKRLGLIYSWAAATNSKGGFNGQGNATQEGASSTQAKVQGICPNGWHLPSDWEWTELENAIISTPSIYSSLSTIPGDQLPQDLIEGLRGTTHGKAMKDPCEPIATGVVTPGASHSIIDGGFSVLLAGMSMNTASQYGQFARFWTSSSLTGKYAWMRAFGYALDTGGRNTQSWRHTLMSIRCKAN